jgi:hypothetical protein
LILELQLSFFEKVGNAKVGADFREEYTRSGFVAIPRCSGLMILDTNLGGKIHLTEVFNDNKKKNIQS